MYAHKDATHSLPLTYVQQAALREHPPDRLMPDPGHKRRYSKWKRRLCTTAPTFGISWPQTPHPGCIILAFPAQGWPKLGYVGSGPVSLPACSSSPGNHDSPSPRAKRSRRLLTSLRRPCFSPSPLEEAYWQTRCSPSSPFYPSVTSTLVPVKMFYKSASSEPCAGETLGSDSTVRADPFLLARRTNSEIALPACCS